jgi:hypothetical protein
MLQKGKLNSSGRLESVLYKEIRVWYLHLTYEGSAPWRTISRSAIAAPVHSISYEVLREKQKVNTLDRKYRRDTSAFEANEEICS